MYNYKLKTLAKILEKNSTDFIFLHSIISYIFKVNYSLHLMLFYISFRYIAQWSDDHILQKVFPRIFPLPVCYHT